MTRRLGLAGLIGVVIVAAVLWRCRAKPAPREKAPPAEPRLDVERLRDTSTRHRQVVQGIAARFPRAAAPTAAARPPIFTLLLSPRCFIGPADLCETLLEPAGACAEGDASACLAVGQYIADTPPRSSIAMSFFRKGCELGDAESCERIKPPAEGEVIDCAVDLMRCAVQARKQNDRVRGAEACDRGVADACDFMMREAAIARDRDLVRTYLTKGCQLGSPMLCQMLGDRLSPGCTGDCLPPDAERAAAAWAFACESGLETACAGRAP